MSIEELKRALEAVDDGETRGLTPESLPKMFELGKCDHCDKDAVVQDNMGSACIKHVEK